MRAHGVAARARCGARPDGLPPRPHDARLLAGDHTATKPLNGVHTDYDDFADLHAPDTVTPTGVPGVQVDGYFTDTSTTDPLHGWNHDSQFVIRLPQGWDGRIVVAGAPGVRRQDSSGFLVSDHVLAEGYAHASIDEGNTGAFFFSDGNEPGDAIREWHARTTRVARAAQRVVRQAYGRPAARTYTTGVYLPGGSSSTGRACSTASSTSRGPCSRPTTPC